MISTQIFLNYIEHQELPSDVPSKYFSGPNVA